jgi:hypothetical protein
MSNLNQHHVRQGIPSSTNWESVALLALAEVADEVVGESRALGETSTRHCRASYEVNRPR